MAREDNIQLYFVLGLIAVVLGVAATVYGTLGYIIVHFVHKFW